MTHEEIKETLAELDHEDSLVFENPNYDNAIIGISHNDRVCYSFEKMIKCLMDEDNMTEEEAIDFIEYNTIRAIPYYGELAPIVIYDIPDITTEDE